MPKYVVNAHVTVSAFAHVEADTPEEAVQKAQLLPVGFEFYDADPDEGFVITEADGDPDQISCVGDTA